MVFRFPIFGGGQYYDREGRLTQYRMWWPIQLGRYIDWFLRTLVGKEPIGMQSTLTLVHRSANTHTPKDQKIALVFIDHDTRGRMIWGTDLSPDSARQIATALVELAEEIQPYFTLRETMQQVMGELNEKLGEVH